ncbi:MAG: hypothetical protein WBD07_11975 [Vicinamibacterales bacterium]
MTGLNWFWIAVALTGPPLAGVLVAFPLWRIEQPIFGNLAGTIVIFGSAIGMIMREDVELVRLVQACVDEGFVVCSPVPSAFARFTIYACIGLAEVIALFSLSLWVEEKIRRRGYAPEWR